MYKLSMDDECIKNRIDAIRQKEGMTSSDFAELIGVGRATVTHILQGRNKPSLDVMLRIYRRFPNVNLEWLMTGEGTMYGNEKGMSYESDLFSSVENSVNAGESTDTDENFKEMASKIPFSVSNPPVKEVVKYVEKPPRKITEIRIFFDDNTFEIFKPEN